MRKFAAALALIVFASGPVVGAESSPSQESEEKQRQAEELAIEATQRFMQAIELMIQALPQYGMPRIDDQGNIIIPRLLNARPPSAQPPSAQPKAKPQPPSEEDEDNEDQSEPTKPGGTRL